MQATGKRVRKLYQRTLRFGYIQQIAMLADGTFAFRDRSSRQTHRSVLGWAKWRPRSGTPTLEGFEEVGVP